MLKERHAVPDGPSELSRGDGGAAAGRHCSATIVDGHEPQVNGGGGLGGGGGGETKGGGGGGLGGGGRANASLNWQNLS